MIESMVTVTILVGLTVLVHYEALRLTSEVLPRLPGTPRSKLIFVIFAAFAAHTVEVWIYAIAYYIFVHVLELGHFHGLHENEFVDYLYFSTVTYTSVGFGDIAPLSNTRLVAGVEALNGLVLIAWTASFTYLVMEKLWPMHLRKPSKPREGA